MAVHVTIDVNQKVVVSTYYGEINDDDLFHVVSLIRSHPDFDPSFSDLMDLSGVTAGTFSTSALYQKSQQESIFDLESMHVMIAPQPHIFGLARMTQVFAAKKKPNTAVVQTIDEARKFLKLEKTSSA